MTGLLVFLGLLGTFWGLIETVGSVGKVIDGLKVGGDAGALFDTLKEGLAAPLGGMGISFSSSLFGLAGSLILGFLDLQSSQAQNRFYTDLEDWLATTVREYGGDDGRRGDMQGAIDRLRAAVEEGGGNRGTTAAMANLAEAIQGLVAHMRTEQQMIREWADGQGEQNREIKRLLERIARPAARRAKCARQLMALAAPPQRTRLQLLAGLRRRAVDAGARRSCSCCRCSWWCSSSCRRKSPARTRRWSSSTPRSRSSTSCCRWRSSASSTSTTSSRNCARARVGRSRARPRQGPL